MNRGAIPVASRAIWLDVIQFVLTWGLFIGFIATLRFMNATPIGELDLGGKSLPEGWEAAYLNHGKYLRGFLISRHPVGFTLSLMLWVGSIIGLAFLHRLKKREKVAGASRSGLHLLVNLAMIAVTAVLAVVFYRTVLTGTLPT